MICVDKGRNNYNRQYPNACRGDSGKYRCHLTHTPYLNCNENRFLISLGIKARTSTKKIPKYLVDMVNQENFVFVKCDICRS